MKTASAFIKRFKLPVSFTLLMGFHQQLLAQQVVRILPEDQRPHLPATATNEKIKVDGKLDEASWAKCPIATHFVINYPKIGNKATYETEVMVLYDDKNIYIGAKCDFPPGKRLMQVQNMNRDFTFADNELFEVLIDPYKDPRQPVMTFNVTPYGTQMDKMHYVYDGSDYYWNTLWRAASTMQVHSWTCEIAIPFSTLRYPANSTSWSINFVRNIRSLGEVSGWSNWPLFFSEARMEYGGILTNIKPPHPDLDLRINPYTLINSSGEGNGRTVYKSHAGGEINWAINNSTVLEGSVNTDFSQADADVQVINLTRSLVFYPEQRQFMLENANLFSVGENGIIQPFFSRTVGLSGEGNPLSITGGLRLIHQDTKRSIGILVMQQKGDSSENGALFGVLRYKANVTKKLTLGGMAILRENNSGMGTSAYLNSVGVADAFYKVNQPLFIRGMFSVSDNSLSRQKGTAAFTEVNYLGSVFYLDWYQTMVSSGYQAQTGFVARNDFINTQPTLGFNIYKHWFPKNLAFFNPQVTSNVFHQTSTGIFQEASVNLIPFQLVFNNESQFNVNVTTSWENLTSNFQPVSNINIQPGNYEFSRYEIYYLSNQGAALSMETRLSTGGYYNGGLNSYYLSVRAAPTPYLSLAISFTQEDFKNTGKNKASSSTNLLAPLLRLASSSKVQLSAFYQYNTDARNGSLNARFSWEYKPLSFIYLVYNSVNNFYQTPFGIPKQQQSGILKLTFIKQL
jgi:hypothetical protein